MIHFGIRKKVNKIKNYFIHNKNRYYHNFLYYMPKKYAHKKLYKFVFNKNLNIDDPTDFNEKLHYLMIYKYGKKESYLSDKIKVKDYIKSKNIKDLYIPKTLKVYKNTKNINISELPDQFVLKCNHASGGVVICNNKNNFPLDNNLNILDRTIKINYAKVAFEYHYKYIKPYIFAEEYLCDNKKLINPIDYKIYCINGNAKSILVCSEREKSLKLSEYDLNWKRIDCITKEFNSLKNIPKPKKLKDIIRIAEELAIGIPFVRIDLYEINNKIFFGEYTFTPAAGICNYYTDYGLKLHGDYINLNLYKKN